MIVINKNQSNLNILELTSSSSLLNPNYLFEFENDLNKSLTYFTAQDMSNFKCRYNSFNIIDDTTPIPLSGQVSLLTGMYTYNVYEASAVTLSVSATTGVVIQTGKAIVNGDNNVSSVYK